RVSKAWSDAMAQDKSFRLTSQYGELFQKYAGASWQKEQQQKTAEALAEGLKKRGDVRADARVETDMSPDALFTRLGSQSRDERWKAARWLGLKCDAHLVDKKDAAMLKKCAAAVPVLVDVLEHHDDETVSNAVDAARQLMDM